jgi:hypothetical protein
MFFLNTCFVEQSLPIYDLHRILKLIPAIEDTHSRPSSSLRPKVSRRCSPRRSSCSFPSPNLDRAKNRTFLARLDQGYEEIVYYPDQYDQENA